MKYRKDIDGLRAVAVLSVVLYHAGVHWLPGGFVGVDIFFVISGYLITQILLDETATGHYSITNFYVRRAQRILPALYFILVVVLLLGLLLLLPSEVLGLSKSVLATTLFSSNFLFWKQSGYFDVSAELKPLLHTWSLAVEEQFYVLWPLILVFCCRHGWSIRAAISILLALSLALSCVFVTETPITVFYLLPGRAWELLIGAWLATAHCHGFKNKWVANGLSLLGVFLLAASVLLLDKSLPFPAWNALFPCMGAALLIAAGEGAVVNRHLLGWRPLVFVGLISYSLYLWHWPLLSYVRILNLGELPPVQAAGALALSFLLAMLTWRYVEAPFRRQGVSVSPVGSLISYALLGLLICMMAWLVIYFKGFPERISVQSLAAQEAVKDFNAARGVCHLNMAQVGLRDVEACTNPRISGALNKTLAIWGDSHAEAMVSGFAVMPGLAEGLVLQMTKTSCPPLLGVTVTRGAMAYRECADFNAATIEMLRQRSDISTVVLAARWPVYVLESGFGVPEETLGAPTYALVAAAGGASTGRPSIAAFGVALNSTIDILVRAGKKVIVVGAVPEMKYDVPGCVARRRMSLVSTGSCNLAQDIVEARISVVNKTIGVAAIRADVQALYPDRILCQDGYCSVEGPDGQVMYHDHNHLSTAGSRYVFSRLVLKE
jgi:peptidoglycan/LPS O-acetylase OafA/YrhL